MIVPLETRPMPEAHNEFEVSEMLSRMFSDGLPGFVVQSTWETNDEAMTAMQPLLEPYQFVIEEKPATRGHLQHPAWHRILPRRMRPTINLTRSKMRYGVAPASGPLHADAPPTDNPVDVLVVDTIELGTAKVELIEPTEHAAKWYKEKPLVRRSLEGDKGTMYLPTKVYDQIWNGEVDDSFIVPVRHEAIATAPTTVVFRSSGRQPVFHQVTSLEVPRISRLRGAYKDAA